MTKDEELKWMIENNKLESQQSTMTYEQGFVHGYEAHRVEKALEQPSNMVAVPLDKLQDMQRRLKALEQSAQEPVRRQCVVCETEYDDGIPPKVKQPAQEPVAWIYFHSRMEPNVDVQFEEPKIKKSFDYDVTWKKPLYTHPHQWQELTDDEIATCFDEVMIMDEISSEFTPINFARAIEQALRTKNHGI